VDKEYRMCRRCIMDTSDPTITFDSNGVCNHCHFFDSIVNNLWFPNKKGETLLSDIVLEIKKTSKGQKYDCILGLSGGVDSSYLAVVAVKELGLNPLAVHINGGWNSEIAERNIEKIVSYLNLNYFTYTINWEEMRDLQVAYLKAGVINQDVPQDHAFFAALYKYATDNNIRYVLSGSNFATESILPASWVYNAMDLRNLKAIYSQFGEYTLKSYPMVSFFRYYFYYPFVKKMKVIKPLNYMPYNKEEAMAKLQKELGWINYGAKHYESRFTKFYQGYFLPKRFGIDKRRAHFSSLILAGQMSREEALLEMQKPPYGSLEELKEDIQYILAKLQLSEDGFDAIMNAPFRAHTDFKSNRTLFRVKDRIKRIIKFF
jgi:N-acetyl sugar amidotransferase